MVEGSVVHAYGIVRAEEHLQLPAQGIGGVPVELLEVDGLGVVVSTLPEAQYGEGQWRAHADDPVWLGAVAAEHNTVLEALVDRTDVLPMRLPGLYRDRSGLEAVVRAEAQQLAAAFDAVRGHLEWGVKVFLERADDEPPEEPRPSSGRDYLARKASQSSRREAARDRRTMHLLDAHEALAHAATHAVVNSPQDRALSGRSEPMLLNAAYLVPRGHHDRFLQLADRLGEQLADNGMLLEVTGPWPPYNFASQPDTALPQSEAHP